MIAALLADVASDYPNLAERHSAGIAIIRVVVGATIALHGYAHLFRGGRIAGTARWFDAIGMRPGKLHAWLATITELVAGLMFAIGLLTPLAAAGIVGLMLVAGWTVHRPNGFFSVRDGWEYTMILAVVAIGIATLGAGEFSVDYALDLTDPDLDGPNGLAIAAGVGLAAGIAQLAIFWRPPKDTSGDDDG